jgi:hypothetical protein
MLQAQLKELSRHQPQSMPPVLLFVMGRWTFLIYQAHSSAASKQYRATW